MLSACVPCYYRMIASHSTNSTLVVPALSVVEDILTVKPGRWRSVARIVTASALAELIALLLLDSSTFWPILTVLILSAKNVGVTWQKSLHRMIGTFIGFALAIMLVAIFPQTPGAVPVDSDLKEPCDRCLADGLKRAFVAPQIDNQKSSVVVAKHRRLFD